MPTVDPTLPAGTSAGHRYNAAGDLVDMRYLKIATQAVFYFVLLTVFLGAAVSAGYSHDENQFIAGGQLLADQHWLPYVDYPYTHMPYAVFFYAFSALLSNYDFLAARLLNAVAWFVSAMLIIHGFRKITQPEATPSLFLWDFVIAFIFASNPILGHIVGNALNHALAAFFSLGALALFARALRTGTPSPRSALGAGVCACLAGLIRFNYASVMLVLGSLLLVHGWWNPSGRSFRGAATFAAGVVIAAIPTLALFVAAPRRFLYTNYVYIRLNTIYYQELLYQVNMQLGQKLLDFAGYLLSTPVDLMLYIVMLYLLIRSAIGYVRTRGSADLILLALAASALALAASAFPPSPTQPQYFLAPIPVLCLLLLLAGRDLGRRSLPALAYLGVALLVMLRLSVDVWRPVASIAGLTRPAEWIPLQSHAFSEQLHQYAPPGPVLSLLPMFALEAGYDVYPFEANGPFVWRTSLLLTPQRRLEYGITSPQELPEVLQRTPPVAILIGFESTNAGFVRNDLGGLETPFIDYARANGFRPIPLAAPFLEQHVTLWTRAP